MIGILASLTLAALTTGSMQTDTTFAVKQGTRLDVNQFAGSIAVDTWAKSAVHLVADHSTRVSIEIGGTWPSLTLEGVHERGLPTTVHYRLTVPKWMALNLSGVNTEISVDNSAGEIHAETVQGEVSVTGGTKIIQASSVDGAVNLRDASGRIECSSVNGAVEIERATGPVAASSVNGEIVLSGIDSDDVEGSTVNGTVSYEGTIKEAGSYRFSSHNGEVTVAIPKSASAAVSVETFSGEFSSDFPIQITEAHRGKRFEFTLGGGGARIELESFQGGIRLRRPSNSGSRNGVEYKYEEKTKEKSKEKTKETTKTKTKTKNAGEEETQP